MRVHKPKKRQGRTDRRFRPGPWSDGRELESGLALEPRFLLTPGSRSGPTLTMYVPLPSAQLPHASRRQPRSTRSTANSRTTLRQS